MYFMLILTIFKKNGGIINTATFYEKIFEKL